MQGQDSENLEVALPRVLPPFWCRLGRHSSEDYRRQRAPGIVISNASFEVVVQGLRCRMLSTDLRHASKHWQS